MVHHILWIEEDELSPASEASISAYVQGFGQTYTRHPKGVLLQLVDELAHSRTVSGMV